ncbi:MAG: PEGA domain-containing protein [Fibrobacterota bacterium]
MFFNKQLPINDPAQRKVARLLKRVTPPEKTASEWLYLENKVLADLTLEHPRLAKPHRPLFSFRPVGAAALMFLLIVAVLFTLGRRTAAPSLASTDARLLLVEGAVESANLSASGVPGSWHRVRALEPFSAGHAFRVPQTGRLRALLDNGTLLELTAGSRFSVSRLDAGNVLLHLEEGAVLLSVAKRAPDRSFAVTTRNARCEVVGTRFKIQAVGNGTAHTTLSVLEGAVSFRERSGRSATLVRSGESAVLSGERLSLTSPVTDPTAFQHDFDELISALPSTGPSGLLSVLSDPPGAEVLLDGMPAGRTPLSLECVSGKHTLTLSHEGFAESRRTLNVSPERPQVMRASLEKIKYLAFLKGLIEKETDISAPAPRVSVSGRKDAPVSFDSLRLAAAEEEMQSNAFGKALSLLNGLASAPALPPETRVRVLEDIARCHRGKGDYRAYAAALEALYAVVGNPVKRDNLLWEIAGIKATYLGRYKEARTDLLAYIAEFKNGIWIQEAYLELAEVQYLLSNTADAARTYRELIRRFPDSPSIDKAVYNLAYLHSHALSDCAEACQWYNRLEREYPGSVYLEDALFWKADCYDKMGLSAKSRDTYSLYLARYPQGRWKDAAAERLLQLVDSAPPKKG